MVLPASLDASLHVKLQRFDVPALSALEAGRVGHFHVFKPVKELETDAAVLQHLVVRCENDVAHASTHLPENCASVCKEHPQRSADSLACRKSGPADVAVLEGESE